MAENKMGILENPFLLDDKRKENLTPYDIYDKIINLRFITGETSNADNNESSYVPTGIYILRSDYEPVFFDANYMDKVTGNTYKNRYYIRKCIHKPSIKVEYKLVAKGLQINLDIYIDNFYMLSSDGRQLTALNIKDNPIKDVQIMMGYFGQFKGMPHSTLSDLFNFTEANGVDILNGRVEYAYSEGVPPNNKLHIHCVIGQAMTLNDYGEEANLESPDFVVPHESRSDSSIMKATYESVAKGLAHAVDSMYEPFEKKAPIYDENGKKIRDNGAYHYTDTTTPTEQISGNYISRFLGKLNSIGEKKKEELNANLSERGYPSSTTTDFGICRVAVPPVIREGNLRDRGFPSSTDENIGVIYEKLTNGNISDRGFPSSRDVNVGNATVNGVEYSDALYTNTELSEGFNFSIVNSDDIITELKIQDTTSIGNIIKESVFGKFVKTGALFDVSMMLADAKAKQSAIENTNSAEVSGNSITEIAKISVSDVTKYFSEFYAMLVKSLKTSVYRDGDSAMYKALSYFCPNIVLSDGVKKVILDIVGSNDYVSKGIVPSIKAETLEQTMNQIRRFIGTDTRMMKTNKGDFLIFTDKEAQDLEFLGNMFNSDRLASYVINNSDFTRNYHNVIPAVYSVDFGALCTVRCPFFSFVNPFQYLFFSNRYVNGSLIQYYTNPDISNVKLYAVQCQISFSTYTDENEMQIQCTSSYNDGLSSQAKSLKEATEKENK